MAINIDPWKTNAPYYDELHETLTLLEKCLIQPLLISDVNVVFLGELRNLSRQEEARILGRSLKDTWGCYCDPASIAEPPAWIILEEIWQPRLPSFLLGLGHHIFACIQATYQVYVDEWYQEVIQQDWYNTTFLNKNRNLTSSVPEPFIYSTTMIYSICFAQLAARRCQSGRIRDVMRDYLQARVTRERTLPDNEFDAVESKMLRTLQHYALTTDP
jgi:hypothetical protein